MGVGVGYKAKPVTPLEDGSLPREECEQLAQQALAIASAILLSTGIHHTVQHLDDTLERTGHSERFGFSISLQGPGQGCVAIVYQWERSPGSASDPEWHSGHYAKTQFAREPTKTHMALCRVAAAWTDAGLAEDPWDDLDFLEDEDAERARSEMEKFIEDLRGMETMFLQGGIPIIGIMPGQETRLTLPADRPTGTEEEELRKELDFAECEAILHRARSGVARAMEADLSMDAEAAQAMIEMIDDDIERMSEITAALMNSMGEEETEKRAEGPGGIAERVIELYESWEELHQHLLRDLPEGPPEATASELLSALLFPPLNRMAVQHLQAEMITREPGDRIREAHRRILLDLADESEEAAGEIAQFEEAGAITGERELRMLAEAREALEHTRNTARLYAELENQ